MKLEKGISAVVTGGASGLGRAAAQALADEGVTVAIFDIAEEAGEAFAKEIGGSFHKVDIMSEESVEAGFEAARAANGQERILVHCAVVSGGGKTVTYDKKTGELLGAHMVGAEVTEMIQGFVVGKTLETTEAELMQTVFPHPTISESMHESVLASYGRALHI